MLFALHTFEQHSTPCVQLAPPPRQHVPPVQLALRQQSAVVVHAAPFAVHAQVPPLHEPEQQSPLFMQLAKLPRQQLPAAVQRPFSQHCAAVEHELPIGAQHVLSRRQYEGPQQSKNPLHAAPIGMHALQWFVESQNSIVHGPQQLSMPPHKAPCKAQQ